jgi:hypothetical protein
MLSDKLLFLVIAIVCLILFIIFKLVHIEGFEDITTPPPIPEGCPTLVPVNRNWWEIEAPRQVVSYITGVRFPIHVIEPAKAILSSFQVPYIKSGESDASGCIVVETSGTYTTKMCDSNSKEQLWKIVQVNDKASFTQLLQAGKVAYSGANQNYDLASGVQFGFFMVISEKDPSMTLASNGGNLTVQRIGNYTSQFWDITKDIGNANIAIYDTNDLTNLGSNYTNPQSQMSSTSLGTGTGTGSNPLLNSTNPTQSSSPGPLNSLFGSSSNKSQPFNINLNLDQKSLMSLFGSVDSTNPSLSNAITMATKPPEGFNPECKSCPSVLTDYIAKNNIPCLGCKL